MCGPWVAMGFGAHARPPWVGAQWDRPWGVRDVCVVSDVRVIMGIYPLLSYRLWAKSVRMHVCARQALASFRTHLRRALVHSADARLCFRLCVRRHKQVGARVVMLAARACVLWPQVLFLWESMPLASLQLASLEEK